MGLMCRRCPIFEVNVIAEKGFSGSLVVSVLRHSKLHYEITSRLNGNELFFLGVCTTVENKTTRVFYGDLVEEVIKCSLSLHH